MRLVVSREARRDVAEATRFVARDDPAAARRLAARIDEAVRRLLEFPSLGVDAGHVRVMTVAGTPFRVLYRRDSGDVVILRIWHGARGWPPVSP